MMKNCALALEIYLLFVCAMSENVFNDCSRTMQPHTEALCTHTILIKIYKERTIMRNEKGCLFIVVGAPDVCRLCEHNEKIMVW